MSNVVSLSNFRHKKRLESKSKKVEEIETLEQIAEKNRKNAERVKRDRYHLNNGVKRSYCLVKTISNSSDEEFL